MKITNNSELLQICNEGICERRAGQSNTQDKEYSLPSLINLVRAAATKIWNTNDNTEHPYLTKIYIQFEHFSR